MLVIRSWNGGWSVLPLALASRRTLLRWESSVVWNWFYLGEKLLKYNLRVRSVTVLQQISSTDADGIREILEELNVTKALGTGGMRPRYHKVAAEHMTIEGECTLKLLVMEVVEATVPAWFLTAWAMVQGVPLTKGINRI